MFPLFLIKGGPDINIISLIMILLALGNCSMEEGARKLGPLSVPWLIAGGNCDRAKKSNGERMREREKRKSE